MKYIFTCLALLCLFSSCKQNNLNPTMEALHNEVMAIHDEVMPKMSNIHKLSKKVKKLIKVNPDGLDMSKSNSLVIQLDEASESMMSWMSEYDKPIDNSDESKSYLFQQKAAISKVKALMESSIRDATAFLESNSITK